MKRYKITYTTEHERTFEAENAKHAAEITAVLLQAAGGKLLSRVQIDPPLPDDHKCAACEKPWPKKGKGAKNNPPRGRPPSGTPGGTSPTRITDSVEARAA